MWTWDSFFFPKLFNINQTGIWEIKEIWKMRWSWTFGDVPKNTGDKIKAVNTYRLLRGNFLQCFIKGYLLPILSTLNHYIAKSQYFFSIWNFSISVHSLKYKTINWLSLTIGRQPNQTGIPLLQMHICWLQESLTTFSILPSSINAGYWSSDTLGDYLESQVPYLLGLWHRLVTEIFIHIIILFTTFL